MPRSLNSGSQGTLVFGAGTAFSTRGDLPSIRYIRTQHSHVFIVDVLNLIPAEEAYFPLGYVFTPPGSPRFGVSGLCHPILVIDNLFTIN